MKTVKRLFVVLLTALFVLGLAGCGGGGNEPETPVVDNGAGEKTPIRLSTTTSVNDSGLMPYLQPEFESDTGYTLEISSAGSGAAIEKGRTGDADCLLVHSPAAEETFIGEGYGEERVTFMYNYFVIVGPADDPAGVKECKEASEAFAKIAETADASFVSRGDESGTHSAEMAIWKIADIDPTGQDWYKSTGQGMGSSLNVAAENGDYILTDKATYLAHAQRDSLDLLLEESDEMMNTYSLIAISELRWDDTNKAGADAFIEWMTSEKARNMIGEFGVAEYGQPLFYNID